MPGPVRKPADQHAGHPNGSSNNLPVPALPGALVPANATVPEAPHGLLKPSNEAWARLWESPVANAIDRDADMHRIQRWILLVDEFWRTSKQLKKEPRLIDGSKGQRVLNPLYTLLFTLEDKIAKTEAEFGLTPKARAALGLDLGRAALTAAQLNALTPSEPATVDSDAEEIDPDGEFTEA